MKRTIQLCVITASLLFSLVMSGCLVNPLDGGQTAKGQQLNATPTATVSPPHPPTGGSGSPKEDTTPPKEGEKSPTATPALHQRDDLAEREKARGLCPSDQAMRKETQLQGTSQENSAPGDWETCKWYVSPNGTKFWLPSDGLLTAKMLNGQHLLFTGGNEGSFVEGVNDGTLRLKRGYVSFSFTKTPCGTYGDQVTGYAAHEFQYAADLRQRTGGADNIQYEFGNFSCPGGGFPSITPGGTGSSQTWKCPVQSSSDAASLVGGLAEFWKQSPDDGTKWIYEEEWNQANNGKTLKIPAGCPSCYFDYWKQPNKKVKEPIPQEKATFNCVQ